MKTRFNFDEVVDRAKKAFKINDDKDLAEFIGLNSKSFSARKRSQSLPIEELLLVANREKVDLNWLLTGQGEIYKNEIAEAKASYTVTLKVLYPELTDNEVKRFEVEIEEAMELKRLKAFVYKNFAGARGESGNNLSFE